MNLVKSCIAVIASVLIIFALAVSNAAAENTLIGDADSDGSVTAIDATVIQRVLANIQEPDDNYLAAGDVDSDGEITIADATLILRYKANLIPSLPFDPNSPTEAPTETPTVFPTDSEGWGQIIIRP